MNDVDPQAWLANVLARVAEHFAQRLDELSPELGNRSQKVDQAAEATATWSLPDA
jgi:hypothetical protein